MPNSPDPLFHEDEADSPPADPAAETNGAYQIRSRTSIRELRRKYGPHFAPGYGDTDTLGQLLLRAGCNSLEEYLRRHPEHAT